MQPTLKCTVLSKKNAHLDNAKKLRSFAPNEKISLSFKKMPLYIFKKFDPKIKI